MIIIILLTIKNFIENLKGIAMGTKCSSSIANIYLYILEKDFLVIHKPLNYSRFIDDIFIITIWYIVSIVK